MRLFYAFGKKIPPLLLVLSVGILLVPSPSFPAEKKILILNSYHQTSDWTASFMEGMTGVLERSKMEFDIHVENMDTERHPPVNSFDYLEYYYQKKYGGFSFDVILLSDNNALEFILPRRGSLFPGVPIVFCGINDFAVEMLQGQTGITGINQDIDIKGTIEFALRIKPDIDEFLVINDRTITGLVNQKKYEKDISHFYGESPAFEFMDDFTLGGLQARLGRLPQNSAVLVLRLHQTKDTRQLSPHEYLKFLSDNCSVPIFSLWRPDFGAGVLGGVVVSEMAQGALAAKYAIRILEGESVSALPVVMRSPNVPMADYRQLKRFNISMDLLPPGTLILNKPESVFKKYRYEIVSAAFIFLLLVTTIIVLFVNIIIRKKTEKALIESEDRWKVLLQTAMDGFCLMDLQGRFNEVNEAFCIMTGYSREELSDMCIADLEVLETPNEISAKIQQLVARKENRFETRHRRKDGSIIDLEVSVQYNPMETGMLSAFFRDITDRKMIETRLRQSQKMEAIGTLAGGIAHDFNNILQPMVGFSELIKEDLPEDNPLQTFADGIFNSCMRARDLVKQILTFSRQDDQEVKPVKLQPLIKEALKLLRSSIPKTIDIRQDIDPECGIILADPTQIYQIVMNLCSNAYHAMETTGGKLDVSLDQIRIESYDPVFPELVPGNYARLKVADTGAGIPQSMVDKIFDPYFTTKKQNKGTGLGLSIVQGIVKRINGDIRLYSELGKGTEVHIYFPIIDMAPPEKITEEIDPVPGRARKILLVDDERAVAQMIYQMLERLGYEVAICIGGIDALKTFKSNPENFDLVITDLTMPHMTGIQLADAINKIRADIPIVLCSGFSEQVLDGKLKAVGIQQQLSKPVIKKELAETIRKVL